MVDLLGLGQNIDLRNILPERSIDFSNIVPQPTSFFLVGGGGFSLSYMATTTEKDEDSYSHC
jgi:hypothetical protein